MKKLVLAMALATLASCLDPQLKKEQAAIPEDNAHRDGPEHHPGYQCTACHTEFSLGGTVYQDSDGRVPAVDAEVTLTDAIGDQRTYLTNSVGTFYELKAQWDPRYPVNVVVVYTDPRDGVRHTNTMETSIGREGGCAFCHKLTGAAADSPFPIYGAKQL